MLPYGKQTITADDIDAVVKVLESDWLTTGPMVDRLESEFSQAVEAKHSVAVSSGTAALHTAMVGAGIGSTLGEQSTDEVIVPAISFVATANAALYVNATPVFADVDSNTLLIDPDDVAKKITPNTKAIMPVGIYGQTANMTAINEIAAKHNLPVIEDAAQSFGATHHGKKSCSLSTIGSTSFFPSKPLGCYGDGGALFTDDDDLGQAMRQIRVHGQMKKHHHPILGLNGRLDTIQAAIVIEKLKIFDDEIEKRQAVANTYAARMDELAGIQSPKPAEGNTSVWAQYTILAENNDAIREQLQERELASLSYYAVPLHLQPVFSHLGHSKGDFPISEQISSQGLSLPMSPYLSPEDAQKVADVMSTVAGN